MYATLVETKDSGLATARQNTCPNSMKKVVKLNVLNSHRRHLNVKLQDVNAKFQLDKGANVSEINGRTDGTTIASREGLACPT
ncbi:unnamed protein product [Cylicostephanus goldi]|uniref:Uncharacterized protein n=1 Tax=Cylicostephanus goldi TaxID=71465 RepID=A0A3P6TKJ5_CYLGO|nr:unnamed protein product [Cylicostephanus goldi]